MAEEFLDLRKCRLAGFDELAGKQVCVNDRHSAFDEELAGRGFPHTDAAGAPQPDATRRSPSPPSTDEPAMPTPRLSST